jgi:hypothetical protein
MTAFSLVEGAYRAIAYQANGPGVDLDPIVDQMGEDSRVFRTQLQRSISNTAPGSQERAEVNVAMAALSASGQLAEFIQRFGEERSGDGARGY